MVSQIRKTSLRLLTVVATICCREEQPCRHLSGCVVQQDYDNRYRRVYNKHMKCPKCGCIESKVLDSRPSQDFLSIRRRRECIDCHFRFTTYEVIENGPLTVVKKDNTRQTFDRSKIRQGIMASCQKRPVSADQIEAIVNEVENRIYSTSRSEISTREIGELVMEQLKTVDDVAFVRFASVYRDFKDVDTFMDELKKLMDQ